MSFKDMPKQAGQRTILWFYFEIFSGRRSPFCTAERGQERMCNQELDLFQHIPGFCMSSLEAFRVLTPELAV